jgi:hypothetical protein
MGEQQLAADGAVLLEQAYQQGLKLQFAADHRVDGASQALVTVNGGDALIAGDAGCDGLGTPVPCLRRKVRIGDQGPG